MKAALKLVGPALILAGLVLLYFAYQAHPSVAGQITSFVSGEPSHRALQYGIAGAVCLLLGLGGTGKGYLKSK